MKPTPSTATATSRSVHTGAPSVAETAISVDNVSKRYRLYKRPTDVLLSVVGRKKRYDDIYAVKDATFSARKGEIVGIVGRNGAGKSTLLKMIAGNLEPTHGKISVNGNLAAILELGTGFHPDYSGRENVYIGGMCLGLTRAEVDEQIDGIIAFSELGDYIDRPFKTYSSGMQSRLTFATATSVNPDVLIVDEALSVGDARFQRRSFSRMEQYRDAGKTILLVSHDTNTVAEFCDRAILLEQGKIIADSDDAKAVVRQYHELLFGGATTKMAAIRENGAIDNKALAPPENPDIDGDVDDDAATDASASTPAPKADAQLSDHYESVTKALGEPGIGDGRAKILDAAILDTSGTPVRILNANTDYFFWMRVEAQRDGVEIVPGFLIKSKKGVDLYGYDTSWARIDNIGPLKAGERADIRLRITNHLADGDYFLTLGLSDAESEKIDLRFDLIEFKTSGTEHAYTTSVVNLNGKFDWTLLKGAGK